MKKMKKVLSILLASMMTLAMAAPGFAAPNVESTETGSITIENATNGESYNVYKLFDANPSGNGNGDDALIAYKATSRQVELLLKAVGEQYDSEASNASDGYFQFTRITTSATPEYNVTYAVDANKQRLKTDSQIVEHLKTFLTAEMKSEEEKLQKAEWTIKEGYEDLFTSGEAKPAENGKVVFDNLKFGYYFVTSTVGSTLTITSTNRDVKVIDKNQGPHWDKEEKDDGGKKIIKINDSKPIINGENGKEEVDSTKEISAKFDDVVTFNVKFEATDYAKDESKDADKNLLKKVETYRLADVLDAGMDYAVDENGKLKGLEVKVGGTPVLAKSDTNPYGYTIGGIEEVFEGEGENKKLVGHTFTIVIPWLKAKADGQEEREFVYQGNAVKTVEVTYSATVNHQAVIAGDGNKNTAKFSWWLENKTPENPEDPKKDPDYKSEEKHTTVYTFALAINKITKDNNGLANAKFKVYPVSSANDNSTNLTAIWVIPTAEKGVYEYVPDTYQSTGNTDPEKTQIVESPEIKGNEAGTTGLIVIKGLQENWYKIEETEAPAGYNKLTEMTQAVEASIASKKDYTTTFKVYRDEDGNIVNTEVTGGQVSEDINAKVPVIPINIENIAGTLLPATGGIGTTIFYAAGIILMAGAVFFVVRRKRA